MPAYRQQVLRLMDNQVALIGLLSRIGATGLGKTISQPDTARADFFSRETPTLDSSASGLVESSASSSPTPNMRRCVSGRIFKRQKAKGNSCLGYQPHYYVARQDSLQRSLLQGNSLGLHNLQNELNCDFYHSSSITLNYSKCKKWGYIKYNCTLT